MYFVAFVVKNLRFDMNRPARLISQLAHPIRAVRIFFLLEPLAHVLHQRLEDGWDQSGTVESRCGAVVLGLAYLLPALSVAGASLASPWLRFHIPLIKPDGRFSRIRLSDKAVLTCCFTRSPTNSCC